MKKLFILISRFYLVFIAELQLVLLGVTKRKNYKVILLEMDLQSTAMYLMSSLGVIDRADFAVFIGTGLENSEVSKYLQWLKAWSRAGNGIPILVTKRKLPCNDPEYKAIHVAHIVRRTYGRRSFPACEIWLGATLEKIDNVKFPRINKTVFVYPFLNFKVSKYDIEQVRYTEVLSRANCLRWMEKNGFLLPTNITWI